MHYIMGTRASKLAIAQAMEVCNKLKKEYPQDDFTIKTITTTGDKHLDKPIDRIGDKGVFVKEIERELTDGDIDIAVHSMKDMPSEIPSELCFSKTWKRQDPRDVLVLREAVSLDDLREGAVVATGSKRRELQLLKLRPDLKIVGIRGNVDTRIRKMHELKLDGLVLAAAGLIRLGKEELITQYLTPEEMIPAAAQGALAIELRREDTELLQKINALADDKTDFEVRTERAFLESKGADCHEAVGAIVINLPEGGRYMKAIYRDRVFRLEI